MSMTEPRGGKSEDVFLLFEMTCAKKGQAILKFALSEVSEFQLEDKSTEGKFALGQENSAPLVVQGGLA